MYVWIDPIYSPRTPINISLTPNKKNTPIAKGAIPIGKELQKIILIIVYVIPTNTLIEPSKKPKKEAKRIGTLLWDTTPSMPISNRE